MRYYYKCKKADSETNVGGCVLSDLPDAFYDGEMEIEVAFNSRSMKVKEGSEGEVDPSSPLVWMVDHSMSDSPEIMCPVCSHKATRVINNVTTFYFRGDGYLDKVGARRDMNLFKLQKDDPYGYMREPGEKDDLMDKLRRGGRHDPKPQYFRTADKVPPKPKSKPKPAKTD